jgi:hypothetical protein
MTGYLHPDYARALGEFGEPIALENSGGWLLRRPVEGTDYHDAMGPYPIFSCRDWDRLAVDLTARRGELVSVALVADSFGAHDEALLRATFDRVIPFKSHFVAELDRPVETIASKHHRYYARKALAQVTVEPVADLAAFLDDWCALYGHLIARHDLTGIKAFSRESFRHQLAVPGLTALRAVHQGRTVGAHLWFTQGEVAHSHLAAVDDVGYEHMAAYALYWRAIEYFSGRVRWLNFGAGAGLKVDADDGLTRFKSGWATGTRTAWFCGRILQPERYEELSTARGLSGADFFPAYRAEVAQPAEPRGSAL